MHRSFFDQLIVSDSRMYPGISEEDIPVSDRYFIKEAFFIERSTLLFTPFIFGKRIRSSFFLRDSQTKTDTFFHSLVLPVLSTERNSKSCCPPSIIRSEDLYSFITPSFSLYSIRFIPDALSYPFALTTAEDTEFLTSRSIEGTSISIFIKILLRSLSLPAISRA